jgi:hypothetical protein
MKTTIKRTRFISSVLFLSLFFINTSTNAQSKISDFSGTWLLNADKCDFGRSTADIARKVMTVTIKQVDNSISISSGDSTEHTESLVKLDGTPSVQITNSIINGIPNFSKKPLTVQVINNRSFITTVPSRVKTYSISSDLQILTIDYKITYGNGELTGKLVYDKKKGD